MGVGGAEGALELLGERGDREDVGGRAAGHKGDMGVRLIDLGADEVGGAGAVRIGAVAGALLGVGADERVENRRGGALGIVVAELMHGYLRDA